MTEFGSIVFYSIVFAIILYFLYNGKRILAFERIGIFLLLVLAVLRFDIGFDYEIYYKDIQALKSALDWYGAEYVFNVFETRLEPTFVFFVWLFKGFTHTYAYVFAVYSMLTIYFWYKAFKDNNTVFWSFFVLIVLLYVFNSFDQIRQALAMSIFLYSLKFLREETKNIKKYSLYILLASAFHLSAILMFVVILFTRFKPRIKLYLTIIVACYALGLVGFWSNFILLFFEYSFFYAQYMDLDTQIATNTGRGYIYTAIVAMYSILMYLTRKDRLYTNILFVGIILFIVASGNLNVNRIANYFLIVNALSVPLYLKYSRKRNFILALFLVLVMQFEVRMVISECSGCIPYDYIGSENFERSRLRPRDHQWE